MTILLTDDVKRDISILFVHMIANNVKSLVASMYWNDDEDHLDDDVEVAFLPGEYGVGSTAIWDIDSIDGLSDILWDIGENGVFLFNAVDLTVEQIGEASMPEPELEIELFDSPILIGKISPVKKKTAKKC
jgi:hypothetical protein